MSQNISHHHNNNSHHHHTNHQSHHNPTSSHNQQHSNNRHSSQRSSSNRQSQLDPSKRNQLPLEPKQPITTVHLPIVIQNGNQSSVTIGSHSALQNHMIEGGSHVGGAILLSSQGLDEEDHRLDNRLDDRLQQVNGNGKNGGAQRLLVSRNLPGLSPANTTLHSVVEVTPTTDVVEHVYENPAFLETHHDDNSHGPPPPHPNSSAPPLPARINSNSIMNSGSTTSTKKEVKPKT
jgi:hypothetical protein